MYERREFSIKSKIIKSGDIRRFARLIDETREEFVKNQSQKDVHYDLSFWVNTIDSVSYASDTTDIFGSEGVLDSKIIKSVGMYFRSYKPNAEASVRMADSRYDAGSYIKVEGFDSTWVNGVFNRLLDSFKSCIDQDFIGTKLKWPMSILSSILIGLALIGIINIIINTTADNGKEIPYWFSLLSVIFSGVIPGVFEKFWPDVEIISGNKQTKASSNLKGFLYIIVVPLVIAIVANIISEII